MARTTNILERDAWGETVKALRPKRAADAPPLRKYLVASVERSKEVDPDTGMRLFTFVASTGVVDREGDILFPDGWDVEAYLANPVILWAHESWSYPVGRATNVELRDDKLYVTVQFTPADVNPEGYKVYKLVEAGFVHAVSVGFRPRSWVWNDEHSGYDFTENELLEVSVVPVPANQEALLAAGVDAATAKWYGGISKGAAASIVLDTIIKEALTFNHTGSAPAGDPPQAPAAEQQFFVSCATSGGDNTTATVTYSDNSGNTWGGHVWRDAGYTDPYQVGDPVPDSGWRFVLPETFTWPPPQDKEAEMTEKMEKALEELAATVAALPGAVKDAVAEALADLELVDEGGGGEPPDDPPPAAEPPAAEPPAEGDAPQGDGDSDDDTYDLGGLTTDDLHVMVEEALDEARTATTGRLPG